MCITAMGPNKRFTLDPTCYSYRFTKVCTTSDRVYCIDAVQTFQIGCIPSILDSWKTTVQMMAKDTISIFHCRQVRPERARFCFLFVFPSFFFILGSGNGAYQAVFDRIVEPALTAFKPDLILVSCGFDACGDDFHQQHFLPF